MTILYLACLNNDPVIQSLLGPKCNPAGGEPLRHHKATATAFYIVIYFGSFQTSARKGAFYHLWNKGKIMFIFILCVDIKQFIDIFPSMPFRSNRRLPVPAEGQNSRRNWLVSQPFLNYKIFSKIFQTDIQATGV